MNTLRKRNTKKYDGVLKMDKRHTFKNRILKSDNKGESLWATGKEIKGLQTRGDTTVPGNPQEVTESFNKYFSTIAENTLKNMTYNINTMLFHQQSEEETIKIGSI
ncbi:hypothetical protein HHI36_019796 [Cryptolaemus montrouzieri]|uniref:Uncharacterized protein n=1 Tax=Cryptolaemus montrouzieri TaxID=559131 RepID=A0ABD2N915_9CUCU